MKKQNVGPEVEKFISQWTSLPHEKVHKEEFIQGLFTNTSYFLLFSKGLEQFILTLNLTCFEKKVRRVFVLVKAASQQQEARLVCNIGGVLERESSTPDSPIEVVGFLKSWPNVSDSRNLIFRRLEHLFYAKSENEQEETAALALGLLMTLLKLYPCSQQTLESTEKLD